MHKRLLFLGYISLTIAALALSSAFNTMGFRIGIPVTVIASVIWAIFIWREWEFGNVLCMLILVLGISLASILQDSRLILLICILATLSTWDLATFHIRLSANKNTINRDRLTRTHILRLIGVMIIGLVLTLLTFGLQLDLEFWQAFILGVLLLAGLSQIFAQLKRTNNE